MAGFLGFFKRGARAAEGGASPSAKRPGSAAAAAESGLMLFQSTGEVISAERCLRDAGFPVEVKGPPPELRTGCDMVLVYPLMEEAAVRAELDKGRIAPIRSVPMSGTELEPVSLYRTTDYGDWFMVQAANVKITVEHATGTIVNVSGGGCPDVPYLASILVGRSIADAEEPRLKGRTLCAYSLQKAFAEARRLWNGGDGTAHFGGKA